MTYEEAVARYAVSMGITLAEAKQDAERTIKAQMARENVPREFAESTWIEDVEDTDNAEIDRISAQAKQSGATKVSARAVDSYGRKHTRTVKEDTEKREIITKIAEIFGNNAEIVNIQQKIDLKIGENHYSVTLTKHRAPKN